MSHKPSKPKEFRDRLFKSGKPNVRRVDLLNDDGYGKDMGVLWAAYKMGSFDSIPTGLSQEDFAHLILGFSYNFDLGWMIEDRNIKYSSGIGPVGIMLAKYDGWSLEPHFESFAWASKKNIFRAFVSYFQMMRYDKDVGVVNVYSMNNDVAFFKHLKEYGVLNYVGRVPGGSRFGDKNVFYVRGRKKCQDLSAVLQIA